VLIVQCFLFQDGGVLALGANVLNMAVIGAGGGWAIYRVISGLLPGARGRVTAVAFAGWLSTVLAAVACAGELAWSGKVAWKSAFTAMGSIHLLIGLGEGLISALVFAAIQRTRPEILATADATDKRWADFVRYGLLAALGLSLFVAPFACPWPDGLEAVAERLGFAQAAAEPSIPALAPDYVFPGVHSAAVATALAGVTGSVIVFALALLLARVLVPKQTQAAATPPRGSL
jgi:cobalt/nickel transport system permease protein